RVTPRDPRSFPTRRSSDLAPLEDGIQMLLALHRPDQRQRPFGRPLPHDAELGKQLSGFDQALANQKLPFLQRQIRVAQLDIALGDRKSTRLNSSHVKISYA